MVSFYAHRARGPRPEERPSGEEVWSTRRERRCRRIFGAPDFSALKISLGGGPEEVTLPSGETVLREAAIYYGVFLNAVITFVIIALIVFLMVKAYNRATNKRDEEDGPSEIDLLTEIRDELKIRA